MSTRYFASTDGQTTVFRGTDRPDGFRFASWGGRIRTISFHNAPKPGCHAAVEITKAQYNTLAAIKNARMKAAGCAYLTSPSDCWVRNTDVEIEATQADIQAYIAALGAKDAAEGIE